MVSVVRLNSFRHTLNRLYMCMNSFAREQKQQIYLFPAEHTRLPSSKDLSLNDILRQQDEGNIPSPGLFQYTAGMPCMVLANVCSSRGLVNGSRGIAVGVILEPDSMI
jgi:hypothetical protein